MIHSGSLLQNATDSIRKCNSYFITKFDRSLLKKCVGLFLTKCGSFITKLTVTTKRYSFIPKCDIYYKMRRLLQIATEDLLLLVQVLLAIFEAFV